MTHKPNPKHPKRNLPQVSKAKHGLMLGFDWDNLGSLAQEMEDLEYIERLKRGFEDISPSPQPAPSPR
jgi:hypothetical protein